MGYVLFLLLRNSSKQPLCHRSVRVERGTDALKSENKNAHTFYHLNYRIGSSIYLMILSFLPVTNILYTIKGKKGCVEGRAENRTARCPFIVVCKTSACVFVAACVSELVT